MNWSLDDEVLQKKLVAVARYFEFGSLLSSRRAGGYANTTYFVTTDKGEYVIKWFLPAKLEKLQQELLYLQRLKQHGFPAAYYYQAPDDASIYQQGNDIAVAMKKLPGRHPHPTKEVKKCALEPQYRTSPCASSTSVSHNKGLTEICIMLSTKAIRVSGI